jgi:hypothetical protein
VPLFNDSCAKLNNALMYELKRADIQMKLTQHNAVYKDGLKLREAESKNFDNA